MILKQDLKLYKSKYHYTAHSIEIHQQRGGRGHQQVARGHLQLRACTLRCSFSFRIKQGIISETSTEVFVLVLFCPNAQVCSLRNDGVRMLHGYLVPCWTTVFGCSVMLLQRKLFGVWWHRSKDDCRNTSLPAETSGVAGCLELAHLPKPCQKRLDAWAHPHNNPADTTQQEYQKVRSVIIGVYAWRARRKKKWPPEQVEAPSFHCNGGNKLLQRHRLQFDLGNKRNFVYHRWRT